MKIITKYLLGKYLKYFFIILISLEIFFVGFDYLQTYKSLPDSANLQLLYILYNSFFILTITLPLSLLFGWIITITVMIKDNNIISFYSLGVSKKDILLPIVLLAFIINTLLISLQTTPLAYAAEVKRKILNNQYFVNEKSNILLKYNDNFVFFKKLFPLEKKAVDIRIFTIKDNKLVKTILAKKAYYQNNKWYIIDAKIIKNPKHIFWEESKLDISYEKFLYTLEGFKPEIINNVYKAKVQYSIPDAVYTILLFNKQELNTNKIEAILYSKVVIPFFVLPILVIVFLYSSISNRFFHAGKFISLWVFAALLIWGVFFLLQKLAIGNILNAKLTLVLPIIILYVVAYYIYKKRIN
jgi:lipopolysaccharide export system permease protein